MAITLGTLITILIFLVIVGVILWLVFYLIPMPVLWRRIIAVILLLLFLLWLASRFGNLRI